MMLLLDTCVLIFDALTPERLSPAARRALADGEGAGDLGCSDISLWEIAMLMDKGRLDPGTDYLSFVRAALSARGLHVFAITPEVAHLSTHLRSVAQQDPADRIIAATAVHHGATLVTADENLRNAAEVPTLW